MPAHLQTRDEFRATLLLRGSVVLAFLCSCSTAPGPSGPSGSGGATGASTGGQAGTGTGGQAGSTTGGQTGSTTGGTDAGTGGSEETGSGGIESGTGGSSTGGSASGGSDSGGSGGTDPEDPEVTVVLAGDDVNSDGPLAVTLEENLTFSGGGHILVRPTNITTEANTKHPVAIWGPGGDTAPAYYIQLLNRMASQGFVIVGIRESTGDSVLMSAAIDWLEEQNADSNSPMYDRLLLDRVGVFGHSMGGLSSEVTALMDDRVTTALLDNSGAFNHDALVDVTIPVGIIYGENGQEAPNAVGDFSNAGNQGPCWLGMMAGGGHGSGPWDAAAANVAWMRWHLGGENFRKDAFLADGGAYNDTGIWTTDFKNWDDWKNWNE